METVMTLEHYVAAVKNGRWKDEILAVRAIKDPKQQDEAIQKLQDVHIVELGSTLKINYDPDIYFNPNAKPLQI